MKDTHSRGYKVELENFSGPMDLLLYLIRKEEVNIHDIPIARILEAYMTHLELLQAVELDETGEFLVMASTLMVIKSKMLLPIEEVDFGEELDPRYELVQQLVDYKRIKEHTSKLEEQAEVQKHRFGRPPSARPGAVVPDEDKSFEDVQVWDVFQLFSRVMEETGGNIKRSHLVEGQVVPVRTYAGRVVERLRGGPVSLMDLWSQDQSRMDLIGYFLAVLLLMKNQSVCAKQDGPFGDIMLQLDAEMSEEDKQELELDDDFSD